MKVFDNYGNEIYPRNNNKSIDILAREVIRGDWGNGNERKKRLTQAGYDYYAVQRRVNQILV
ncbi:MAG: lysozyme, partial [Anaerococcus hydrogenalis]|nr:lysozyme [Anaerococcus hydrogenalis]